MGGSSGRMGGSTTAEEAAVDMNLEGKTCVVTGANTGIGKETARVLAKHKATVIMAGRSIERNQAARNYLVANLKQSDPNFNENLLKIMELDLGSFQSIKTFARNYTKEHNQLHYLINNAGMMAGKFEGTKEGYETHFGVNHLGTFYLTLLLTNVLKQSKPSRVVVVSSELHNKAPNPFINSIKEYNQKSDGPSKENFDSMTYYGTSKACNLLFAREYNRRYQSAGVTCVSLHPGVIATELSRDMPSFMQFVLKSAIARPFLKTVPQGAATSIRCCSLKDNEIQGGHYYKDCNDFNGQIQQQFRINVDYNTLTDEQVANDQAYLLWQVSEKLVTQKGFTFNLNDNNNEQKDNAENNANVSVTSTTTATTYAANDSNMKTDIQQSSDNMDSNNSDKQVIEEEN